jgi:hypothetical protein
MGRLCVGRARSAFRRKRLHGPAIANTVLLRTTGMASLYTYQGGDSVAMGDSQDVRAYWSAGCSRRQSLFDASISESLPLRPPCCCAPRVWPTRRGTSAGATSIGMVDVQDEAWRARAHSVPGPVKSDGCVECGSSISFGGDIPFGVAQDRLCVPYRGTE